MTAPKRPGNPPESPSGTVVMGPAAPKREEDLPAVEVPPGATAFVRAPRRKPPEPEPPPEPPEPEVEPYRPQPADDYLGHVEAAAPPRWKVWLWRSLAVCIGLFLLGTAGIVAGYLYL